MKEINVTPVPVNTGNDMQPKLLSKLLEIAVIDSEGERLGSRRRRQLVNRIPAEMGAFQIDDFLNNDPTAPRRQARELLLTDAIESTSIIQEQVYRTVVAGAEKFKVIRDAGVSWYPTKSNALRVPLGEAQRNADEVAESTAIPDRTQDYDKRDFTIVKYGVKPRISFEMLEDGLVDVIAEEVFYAGAAVENKLNYDALTALATAAAAASNLTTGVGSGTGGTGLTFVREAKRRVKANGFIADTIIMCSEFEDDLLANTQLNTPYASLGEGVVRQGILPTPLQGLRWYVTDNGHASAVDGSHAWGYANDSEVAAVVMEAKRGCGVAMRRDRTVKRFEDIIRELETITVTMRCDVNYLHANALCNIEYDTA
jgi:hypothetical protein